jgi:serine/threonine protein kinase
VEVSLKVEVGPSRGTTFALTDGDTKTLGKGPGADFVLADPSLLARHAALMVQDGAFSVVDMGSPAGMSLNDERLPPRQPTEAWSGDSLALGACVLRVTVQGRSTRDSSDRGGQTASQSVLPENEFEQVRQIGAGAMGVVYAAVWKPQQRWVAVKVLHETVDPNSVDYQRFFRECDTMARVASPYVVQVLDVRNTGGRAYSIQELVEGPSVQQRLMQGPLSIPGALRIGEDVAQALTAAAALGIVHRDIKPANMLITPQRVIKLCDFGIAKDLDSTMQSLTVSGMGLGTMAYLPPEQVSEAKHVDPRADVYSLGATLYHLIAGKPPFQPRSADALLAVISQEPTPLESLRADCPPEVCQAVRAMMSKDVQQRPPARRALSALQELRARFYPGYTGADLFGG